MTHRCICQTCEEEFNSRNKNNRVCYGCALTQLVGNKAPEEGDINTALLISGEMSDENAQSLQEDLESVDHSREEEFERRLVEDRDDEDHRWDYLEERDDE